MYCRCISLLFGPQLRHRIIYNIYICVFIIGRRDFSLSHSLCVVFFLIFGVSVLKFMAKNFDRIYVSVFPCSLSLPLSVHTVSLSLSFSGSSVHIIRCTLFSALFLKCIVLRFKLYRSRCVCERALTTHT